MSLEFSYSGWRSAACLGMGGVISLIVFCLPVAARADGPAQTMAAMQAQIDSLQAQLNALKSQMKASSASTQPSTIAARDVPPSDLALTAPAPGAVPSSGSTPPPSAAPSAIPKNGNDPAEPTPNPARTASAVPGLKVTAGGFVAAEAVERSKNETTDVASSFNNLIPFKNAANAHQSEFRGSARQSRLTLLAEGTVDADTKISAYGEADFLGAAPTANSIESNGYNPRLRVGYATIDKSDWNFHLLAGQNWSLLTMNKTGIQPRQENIPLTIDAQYVPGFNWTRNPQLRIVGDFDDKKIWAGFSLESPQVNLGGSTTVTDSNGIAVPAGINATNTGNSPLSTAAYSTDYAPDIIAKVAADPGFGHFEMFGLLRFFHDNVGNGFHNNRTTGEGIGGGAIVPLVPKLLDAQANIMVGRGVGRYSSGLLPDFAFDTGGGIDPLREVTWLSGLIAHPNPNLDLYLYAGGEKVGRDNQTTPGFGYGDFALNNSACNTKGAACPAQTSSIWQITPGAWQQLYKGKFGMMKVGLQDSVTRRNTFTDAGGNGPHAYENVVLTSLRYYPAP